MKFSTSQSRSSRISVETSSIVCFKRFCFCILHFLPDLPARCGIEAEYWISSSLKLSTPHLLRSTVVNYKKNQSQEGPCAKKPVKKQQQEQCGFKKSRQFCNIYSFFIQSDTKTSQETQQWMKKEQKKPPQAHRRVHNTIIL